MKAKLIATIPKFGIFKADKTDKELHKTMTEAGYKILIETNGEIIWIEK